MSAVNPMKRRGDAKKIDSAKQTQVTVSGGKFKKLTVDVDPELYKKFSHYVIDNGTSVHYCEGNGVGILTCSHKGPTGRT